jgi:hypothetical protein
LKFWIWIHLKCWISDSINPDPQLWNQFSARNRITVLGHGTK